MKTISGITLFVLLTLAVASHSAQATPMLMLSDGTTTVTIADGGMGDANPVAGAVTYVGAVGGNWIVNVSTGLTKPVLGSSMSPHMDINSTNVSLGSGTLTIKFSDTDFGPFDGQFADRIGGTINSGTGSTVVATQYFDQANSDFSGFPDADNLIATLGPFGPGAFSGTVYSSAVEGDYPFSLTQVVVITHRGVGNTSFNYDKSAVPEPSALLLLGSGLAGFAYLRRRTFGSMKR